MGLLLLAVSQYAFRIHGVVACTYRRFQRQDAIDQAQVAGYQRRGLGTSWR